MPFFTVFIVRQLVFDASPVLILSAASHLANLAALRTWDKLSDRFINKSLLLVSAPVRILCIVTMIGASQFAQPSLVIAWPAVLHILMRCSSGRPLVGLTMGSEPANGKDREEEGYGARTSVDQDRRRRLLNPRTHSGR